MKFSILLANYNNGEYIKEAINSIIAQSYEDWEIVIVDDASTDESDEIIKTYNNNERIKYITNTENKGCGYTKHKCAKLASGDIFGFLDPDDKLTPNAIEVMVKEHKKNLKCSLIFSNRFVCDDKLNPRKNQPEISFDSSKSLLEQSEGQVSHFVTFKKKYYEKTVGINESFKRAVDMDLYYKLEEVGQINFTEQRLYYWRVHKNGISTHNNFPKARAWGIYAKIKACQRRGIPFEGIISKNILDSQVTENYYRNTIEFKIGFTLLKPIRFFKSLFKNNLPISS